MSGLSNDYVSKIGKKFLGKSFLGVFACDEKPRLKNRSNFKIIFNTDTHDSEGEHFVAVAKQKKKLIYFDSFGKNVENEMIQKFIDENLKTGDKYFYNCIQIQADESNFCGFYCVAFLMSMNKKMSFQNFISSFSVQKNRLLKNDGKCIKFILKHAE
jgi:hypothetical protein